MPAKQHELPQGPVPVVTAEGADVSDEHAQASKACHFWQENREQPETPSDC